MKNLVLFFILFSGPVFLSAQADYLEEFKQKWANAEAYTMEVAELMPAEDYAYQPNGEQMTFQEQLLHMVGNMRWLSSSHLGARRYEVDLKKSDYTKDEVLDILRQGFERVRNALEELEPAKLQEEVSFFAGPMTKRQILTLMNDHLTHHRAQVIVYLRLKGIAPPSYRGW